MLEVVRATYITQDGKRFIFEAIEIPFIWKTYKRKGHTIKSYEPTKDSKNILNQFASWEKASDNEQYLFDVSATIK